MLFLECIYYCHIWARGRNCNTKWWHTLIKPKEIKGSKTNTRHKRFSMSQSSLQQLFRDNMPPSSHLTELKEKWLRGWGANSCYFPKHSHSFWFLKHTHTFWYRSLAKACQFFTILTVVYTYYPHAPSIFQVARFLFSQQAFILYLYINLWLFLYKCIVSISDTVVIIISCSTTFSKVDLQSWLYLSHAYEHF